MSSCRDNTRPLSILHIAAPAAVGGLETVVQTLAIGHRRLGHCVRVLAVVDVGQSDHPFFDPLVKADVEVIPLQLPRRAYLAERRFVKDLCSRFRPDVVHTHGERPDVLDAGVARRLGIPTVTTLHGASKLGGLGPFYEWLQLMVLRRFDAVVVVSRPLAQSLGRYRVPTDRIWTVPNCWSGLAPDLSREGARRALGLPLGEFVVGWVGRLIPVKGGDIFLEALALISDLPVCVSIVGDGSEMSGLRERAASLGLGERIVFHGQVGNAAHIFPAFDLFVLSSRTEGTPSVLFEAMAAGVPIVASRVGGVPDVVSDAEGFLVPPDEPAALAAAMRTAYSDLHGARRRALAARARLSADFDVGSWLSRYEAIYRRIQRVPQERE